MRRAGVLARLAVVGIVLPLQLASSQVSGLSNVQYDLKLLVNDRPVNFSVSWRCRWGYNFPNMGPGDILQRVLKPSVSGGWIARKLPDGSALFWRLNASCYGEPTQHFDPPAIHIVDDAANPRSLQIFSRDRQVGMGYTVRIVSASIVDSGNAKPDSFNIRQSRKLMDLVRNGCSGYQRVVAYAFPESGWKRFGGFSEQFSALTSFSLGPFRNMEYFNSIPVYPISLIREGFTWHLPPMAHVENLADVYWPMDGPRQTTDKLRGDDLERRVPPVTVEIGSVQFLLDTQPRYAYEPNNHWIIKFSNDKYNCWSLR